MRLPYKIAGKRIPGGRHSTFVRTVDAYEPELLYTAVTRARKCVTLVGNEVTFAQMVQNTSQQKRYSGLCDRLKEA